MKKTIISISLILIILLGYIFYTINNVANRVPKIPTDPVKIKVDAEKVGKKIGDFKRKFLKGYHDTTTLKVDSLKHE